MAKTRSEFVLGFVCFFCSSPQTSVKDSRSIKNGRFIKRRRVCVNKACGKSFFTLECVYENDRGPGFKDRETDTIFIPKEAEAKDVE